MEFIDGHPVTETRVRFRQRATVEEAHAPVVRDGDTIVWLVKARCRPPQYFPAGDDDRYKLAIQDVEQVAPLEGALRESALVYLDHGQDQGYIALSDQVPLDLAFEAPRVTSNGFVDPKEVLELRELLGGLTRQGERLAQTVRRLLYDEVERVIRDEPRPEPEPELEHRVDDPDYADAFERARAVLDEEPEPARTAPLHEPLVPLDGDVEVVGHIRHGRRSDLDQLLDNAFGSPR